jgi:hypothetical protein
LAGLDVSNEGYKYSKRYTGVNAILERVSVFGMFIDRFHVFEKDFNKFMNI